MTEPRCSAISRTFDEDLHGTASIVRSWVLLEQPGPWGPDALAESDLPAEVAGPLAAQSRRHRFRALLIRRPDRAERAGAGGRRCFVAHSARGRTWIEHRTLAEPAEVLDVDFARLRAGEPVGFGDPYDGRLHLVCTNGSHDPCCAQYGRPVVRALLDPGGDSVWESSHLGGDRFAANLVCLPHGLYFGRLEPAAARRVVDAYAAGAIALDRYRGRAGDPLEVQAAECFLRTDTALLGVDDLAPAGRHRHAEPGTVDVDFSAADGRRFTVRLAVAPAPAPRPLTCAGSQAQRPPGYAKVWVRPA